jgi:diaminopimelate epimerase
VYGEGKAIRYNDRFSAAGTNVNFVQRLSANEIYVRTYERGVEHETLSCGTGVTACALTAGLEGAESPVSVQTPGGNLQVTFEQYGFGFRYVYLIGPAKLVYSGTVPLAEKV